MRNAVIDNFTLRSIAIRDDTTSRLHVLFIYIHVYTPVCGRHVIISTIYSRRYASVCACACTIEYQRTGEIPANLSEPFYIEEHLEHYGELIKIRILRANAGENKKRDDPGKANVDVNKS